MGKGLGLGLGLGVGLGLGLGLGLWMGRIASFSRAADSAGRERLRRG